MRLPISRLPNWCGQAVWATKPLDAKLSCSGAVTHAARSLLNTTSLRTSQRQACCLHTIACMGLRYALSSAAGLFSIRSVPPSSESSRNLEQRGALLAHLKAHLAIFDGSATEIYWNLAIQISKSQGNRWRLVGWSNFAICCDLHRPNFNPFAPLQKKDRPWRATFDYLPSGPSLPAPFPTTNPKKESMIIYATESLFGILQMIRSSSVV